MKVTITVGPVQIRTSGLDLTERQVRRLLAQAGQIAESLLDNSPDEKAEEECTPVGFAAHVERAPEPARESYFTDDDE